MTTGSCSVAIRRSRPPQREHSSTSIAKARYIKAAQLQAREPLVNSVRSDVPFEPATSADAKAVGSSATRPYATTRSRQRARAPNSPWQISRFGSGRGVIAARRSNNSSGSNTKLARAVVPRRLQLQRDASVAPPPQALLRKRRTQEVSAQTLQARPVVRRHPHVGVQIEALEMRLPRPARRHGLRVARVAEPPHSRPRTRAQRASVNTPSSTKV